MRALAVPGSPVTLVLLASLVLAVLLWRQHWQSATAWALGLLAAAVLAVTLNLIPQPAIHYAILTASGSIPGMTGAVSAAAYGMLALFSARSLPIRWRPQLVSAFSLLLSAFARLNLGLSLLSEELAGLAFGLVWSGLDLWEWFMSRVGSDRCAPVRCS